MFRCAHCDADLGALSMFGHPRPVDVGGSCPGCRKDLCRRCAGGWCDAVTPEDPIRLAAREGGIGLRAVELLRSGVLVVPGATPAQVRIGFRGVDEPLRVEIDGSASFYFPAQMVAGEGCPPPVKLAWQIIRRAAELVRDARGDVSAAARPS